MGSTSLERRVLGGTVGVVDRVAPWVAGLAVAVLSIVLPAAGLWPVTVTDPAAGLWPAAVTDPAAAQWPAAVTDPWRLLFAVVCGAAAWGGRRWRWPLIVAGVAAWLLLAQWHVFTVATYHVVTDAPWRRLVPFYVTAVAGLVAVRPAFAPGDGWTLEGVGASLVWAVALPVAAALWVVMRRQVVAGLRERAERLEREQAARAEQARTQERTRIAREMHDVVAHRVSLMVLHAGALEVSVPDERTAAELGAIRATGREALADLREVLGLLRTPESGDGHAPPPTLADLDRLLGRSRSAGLRVRRRDEGGPRPVPEAVQRAAYRVVQEALTNVHKHVGECEVEVVLAYTPDGLEVVVANGPPAGSRTAAGLPPSGLGLLGLRERVALLGGRLRTEVRPGGGFTVTALIPVEPA